MSEEKKNVPLSDDKLDEAAGGTGLIIDSPTYTYAPSVYSKCGGAMMKSIRMARCTKCGWTVNIVHNAPDFI